MAAAGRPKAELVRTEEERSSPSASSAATEGAGSRTVGTHRARMQLWPDELDGGTTDICVGHRPRTLIFNLDHLVDPVAHFRYRCVALSRAEYAADEFL